MFLWLDSASQTKVYFTSAKKDIVNFKLIMYLLSGEKVVEEFDSLDDLESRINGMINDGIYVEINTDLTNVTKIEKIKRAQDIGSFQISYLFDTGDRVIEKFNNEFTRDVKIDTLEVFNVPGPDIPPGKIDYNDLENKPTINYIELEGNIRTADLGIKSSELNNDIGFVTKTTSSLVNYYDRTTIDEKLENLSGIPVLEGTEEEPIIAGNLETSVYVISGVVQSSEHNTTRTVVRKRFYSVWKDPDKCVFWQEDPVGDIKNYILFKIEGTDVPTTGQTRAVSEDFLEDYVANALIDAGEVEGE